MSILIDKNTRVMTQGITGKTGMFHTKTGKEYANGKNCYVAGVTPKKGGQSYEGIPIFNSVREARDATGANVSVIYVPPPFAAAAIEEAVEADLDLVIAKASGRWQVDLVAGANQIRAATDNDNGHDNNRTWDSYAGVQVQIPIGDISTRQAEVKPKAA